MRYQPHTLDLTLTRLKHEVFTTQNLLCLQFGSNSFPNVSDTDLVTVCLPYYQHNPLSLAGSGDSFTDTSYFLTSDVSSNNILLAIISIVFRLAGGSSSRFLLILFIFWHSNLSTAPDKARKTTPALATSYFRWLHFLDHLPATQGAF